jgi:putative endonuclease
MLFSNNQNKKDNILTGKKFEKRAAKYFEKLGFKILERNWRSGHKEIDLIIKKDNLLVFVEVKSSYTKKFGHPSERVDEKKISNITNCAQDYLITKKIDNIDIQFDVVTFTNGELEHYPHAFEATE